MVAEVSCVARTVVTAGKSSIIAQIISCTISNQKSLFVKLFIVAKLVINC